VFSTGGEVVAGARIRVCRRETPQGFRARVAKGEDVVALGTATSGENGAFTLETKAAGVLRLIVERDGFVPKLVHVLAEDEASLVVELVPAAVRTGHVTANGKPVGGAMVMARTEDGAWTTRTDERGAYTLAEPKSWVSQLVIVHPGYAPLTLDVKPRMSLDAALVAGTSISGKVVRKNGAAVAHAQVVADDWSMATSGEDGAFVLHHVPADVKIIEAFDDSSSGSAPRGEGTVTIRAAARSPDA
jgi:hypothetical protein